MKTCPRCGDYHLNPIPFCTACEDDLVYPAILTTAEEGGYLVNFPDFKGAAFTEGETLEEALFMAADVLDLVLEDRLEKGEPIPAPGQLEGPNVYMVTRSPHKRG